MTPDELRAIMSFLQQKIYLKDREAESEVAIEYARDVISEYIRKRAQL